MFDARVIRKKAQCFDWDSLSAENSTARLIEHSAESLLKSDHVRIFLTDSRIGIRVEPFRAIFYVGYFPPSEPLRMASIKRLGIRPASFWTSVSRAA
jgi:hypothetical protein